MVYKGGFIVPVLIGMLLMVVVFSIERFMVISKAAGKGNLDTFMKKVQANIKSGDIEWSYRLLVINNKVLLQMQSNLL